MNPNHPGPYAKPVRKPKVHAGMSRESDRNKARREVRKSVRQQQLAFYPYCEVRAAKGPWKCWGGLTLHHVWTLARGGPDDLRNSRTVCGEHNRGLSQDAECMRWAYANGFLVHADDGPAWLAAGGVQR